MVKCKGMFLEEMLLLFLVFGGLNKIMILRLWYLSCFVFVEFSYVVVCFVVVVVCD